MDEVSTVELGGHQYEVVPQRHARLERKLIGEQGVFANMDQLTDLSNLGGSDALTGFVNLVGEKIYDVLLVFIPDLMERWQFEGYANQEAYEAGDYVEHLDSSPTVPELTVALNAAIDVNGLRFLGKIKDFFDPKMLRAQANASVARWATEQRNQTGDGTPPNSRAGNGELPPTTTSPSEPTPEPPTEVVEPSAGRTPD